MSYFTDRRSVRRFQDKPIDAQLLRSIVAQAVKAPTTGNMQLYSIISSRKGESRKPLEAMHFNQPAATGADVLLTVCADFGRFSRWCEVSDAAPGYDNFLSLTSAMADALIVAQQIVTVAEMNGLGTCYLGTVTYNAAEIAEALHLPRLTMPVACIALGYPDGEGEETERLDVDAVLYEERYPEMSDDDIRRLYRPKDDYPANRKFVEENGKQTLAQVFTDVRYTREMNEQMSRRLMDFLRVQGFID